MGFAENIAADAEKFLDEFGETVIYKRKNKAPRNIKAVVDRSPPAELAQIGRGMAPRLTIRIKNSATEGISSDEVDTGGDKISVPLRLGQAAQDRPITGIVDQDEGMMTLGVN